MPYKNKETERAYQAEWCKKNIKGLYIKLSKTADADIITFLDSVPNKQGFIKELIRKNM